MNNLVDKYVYETWLSARSLDKAIAKAKKKNIISREKRKKVEDQVRAMIKAERITTEGVKLVPKSVTNFIQRAGTRNITRNIFRKDKKSIIYDAKEQWKKDRLKQAKAIEKAHKVEAKKSAKEAAKLAKEQKNKEYYAKRNKKISKLRDDIIDLDRKSY